MATTSELQAIKNANPSFSIPGLDTSAGLQIAESNLKSPATLAEMTGVYYDPARNIVLVHGDGVTLSGIDLTGLTVMVQADNVTVSNCKFDATSGSYALKVFPGYSNATTTASSSTGRSTISSSRRATIRRSRTASSSTRRATRSTSKAEPSRTTPSRAPDTTPTGIRTRSGSARRRGRSRSATT
jgi:hypothetical protein